jgi:processive 1,2-diacylglycerol beta-glucosyltransferase
MNVVLAHKGGSGKRLPVYACITDYDVHPAWVNKEVAGYFVATPEVAWQLATYGYPSERIRVTGIPILPAFRRPLTSQEAIEKLGVPAEGVRILIMAGGFGIGDMEQTVRRLSVLSQRPTLLAVAGRNARLHDRLKALELSLEGRLKVFGFVSNVQDLMAASHLMISKSGGLTVSECLASHLPMVVFAPIPGQEERNADYLMEHGAAVKAPTSDLLVFKIGELLEAPGRLRKMKKAARALGRPRAAEEILDGLLKDAKG